MNIHTRVIFRVLRDGGDVIALFPELPGDGNPYVTCLSYQHVGQHGAACVNLIPAYTRPASFDEYAPLLKELAALGYSVKIAHRRSRLDEHKRAAACSPRRSRIAPHKWPIR